MDFMSGAVYLGKGEVELLNGQVLLCAPSAVHIKDGQSAPPCEDSFVERSGRMKKIMMISCGAMGGAILYQGAFPKASGRRRVYVKASTEKSTVERLSDGVSGFSERYRESGSCPFGSEAGHDPFCFERNKSVPTSGG